MKLTGNIWKGRSDGLWIIEIPLLDLMTQAKTKNGAPEMVKDAIETLINDDTFTIEASLHGNQLLIAANNPKLLIALILRRQRRRKNLTLEEVAKHLKARSINEYAQYEQGKHQPSFEKFAKLLQAIDPELCPVISCM